MKVIVKDYVTFRPTISENWLILEIPIKVNEAEKIEKYKKLSITIEEIE